MSPLPRPDVDISARCACDAVAIGVRGQVLSMLICSCEACQKATGTGHSAIALVDRSAVTVTGETRPFSRPADSGATFTRHFCPVCGTPLHGYSSRAERLIALPVGLFGPQTDWFQPARLIFARSHRDWDWIVEGLPRHNTYPERELHNV